jgi:uncharacterized membrane protein
MANENQSDFQSLLQKVEDIRQKQDALQNELFDVKQKIQLLQRGTFTAPVLEKSVDKPTVTFVAPSPPRLVQEDKKEEKVFIEEQKPAISPVLRDWEQFIGENLSNKIGIIITVLGVSIGAKYAIDNDLISPLMRILIGYVLSFGLYFTSFRLREKYEDLSAVILSGALACLYFLTYAAFSFYHLIPQTLSFLLMLALTVWAVRAALSYERQIIALGALMGAYGIPFLLSTGEDKPLVLFTYMAIVNIGILYLATQKNWNLLYYTAFSFTWLLLTTWTLYNYREPHFYLKLGFLLLFLLLFYATFLVYKIQKQVVFQRRDVAILLLNSTFYYGLTYSVLDNKDWSDYLGIFTVCNALIHLAVAFFIYKKDLADKNVFYLVQGLFIAFLTMAIPVQFDGNWVTLLWVLEGALLFWIGRTKENAGIYEKMSYALIALSIVSLLGDWSEYKDPMIFTPVLNISFWSNIFAALGFGFILKTNLDYPLQNDKTQKQQSFNIMLSLLLIVVTYFTFYIEIAAFFDKKYAIEDNIGVLYFRSIWLINYTSLFVGILFYLNKKYIHNRFFTDFINILALISLFTFLTIGLYIMGDLKNMYQYQSNTSIFNIWIRYISMLFAAIPLFAIYDNFKEKAGTLHQEILLHAILNVTSLWVLSSEVIYWSEWFGWYEQSYRLLLSLLWGIYALGLIVFGIKNIEKKHLRLGGIGLFALTLLKLFVFDLANLGTISKTIVLVGLGLLLLLVSYVYNRYKDKFE